MRHERRGSAALGDGWHVGVVTVLPDETSVVLDVLGIARGRRFHTGRMALPGGVAYLVASPPAGSGGVATALAGLCDRYDPAVVALVGGGRENGAAPGEQAADTTGGSSGPSDSVLLAGGQEPVVGAVDAFFAGAGEPAGLPGYGGAAPFRVFRDPDGGGEVARFCAGVTTRRGKPLAWAVIRGDVRDAAQTLRYLIPYLRPPRRRPSAPLAPG